MSTVNVMSQRQIQNNKDAYTKRVLLKRQAKYIIRRQLMQRQRDISAFVTEPDSEGVREMKIFECKPEYMKSLNSAIGIYCRVMGYKGEDEFWEDVTGAAYMDPNDDVEMSLPFLVAPTILCFFVECLCKDHSMNLTGSVDFYLTMTKKINETYFRGKFI